MFVAELSHPIAHAIASQPEGHSDGSAAPSYVACSDINSVSCDRPFAAHNNVQKKSDTLLSRWAHWSIQTCRTARTFAYQPAAGAARML